MTRLLITGGAGFIGSHTCVVLLNAGYQLVILDDFSNSCSEAIIRVKSLSNNYLQHVRGDIRDEAIIQKIFSDAASSGSPIEGVIHFAGLKAVGESVEQPLRYWDVNVCGSCALLKVMKNNNCNVLVFSSSATIYGHPSSVPIPESAPIQPINPYGESKASVEQMLTNLAHSEPRKWRIACLRYFNPVGAHPSGKIGEDPNGTPNNLFPYLSQVAIGRLKCLKVFGDNWPTVDGSGVRDYIHVMDLAEGHLAALNYLISEPPQLLTLNLGSGVGASVLEVIKAFEKACGLSIPFEIVDKRLGDAPITIADPGLASTKLGWSSKRTLDDICRDGWAWQSANPYGYRNAI